MRRPDMTVVPRAARTSVAAAVGFGALAAVVGARSPGSWSWDASGSAEAHRAAADHAWLANLSKTVTFLGSPTVVDLLVVVAAAGLWLAGRRGAAARVVAARALAQVVDSSVKLLIGRARPQLTPVLAHAAGFSFPSGHAAGAASCYLPIAVAVTAGSVKRSRRRLVVTAAALLCVTVAASRVLLGVHFPTDVTAGLLLGVAATSGAWAVRCGREVPEH